MPALYHGLVGSPGFGFSRKIDQLELFVHEDRSALITSSFRFTLMTASARPRCANPWIIFRARSRCRHSSE